MKDGYASSTFKGSIRVRSTPAGYAVSFECQTDAHDLGHALAAIIAHYLEACRRDHPRCDSHQLNQLVLDGICCGIENNPQPLKQH